ncbi:UNVERIFIED_CONTAM: bifunctional ornithine acetyltransferase/N-acetylglutamate synthase, partial [Bacteroidetes bacterium 56_B9]
RFVGIAKGSGMIHQSLCTLLLFMSTVAMVSPAALLKALCTVVPARLYLMSVVGDTSWIDSVLLLDCGLSGAEFAEGTRFY